MPAAELGSWLGRPVGHWRATWGLPRLAVHERVGSTNDIARDLALHGAPEGTTVIAEEQERGRGRKGSGWIAPAGTSLLLSMVFRPPTPGSNTLLSLRLGIAAARAIEAVAPLEVAIKWPNDLLVDGCKVAGILCEGTTEKGRTLHVIAGIGINVSQPDEAWPPELRGLAASLETGGRATVDRAALAGHLVARWLDAGREHGHRLLPPELHELRRRDSLLGQPILVDGRPAGTARGIDADGALLAGSDPAPSRIIAGSVRIRSSEPLRRP